MLTIFARLRHRQVSGSQWLGKRCWAVAKSNPTGSRVIHLKSTSVIKETSRKDFLLKDHDIVTLRVNIFTCLHRRQKIAGTSKLLMKEKDFDKARVSVLRKRTAGRNGVRRTGRTNLSLPWRFAQYANMYIGNATFLVSCGGDRSSHFLLKGWFWIVMDFRSVRLRMSRKLRKRSSHKENNKLERCLWLVGDQCCVLFLRYRYLFVVCLYDVIGRWGHRR